MVLYYRRKVILALLEKIGGSTTAKCMQKYLFIFTREQSGERIYDFLPHKYGCFSYVANNDIHALAHHGFLTIDELPNQESRYTLTSDTGVFHQLGVFDQQIIDRIIDDFSSFSQEELITYTYRHWPITAINSQIKDRLLTKQELERVNDLKLRYVATEPMLLTLGYEGISIEKYINLLIANGVKILCDVRKNAYSQKYGFTKAVLQKACDAVQIQYIHVPELGIDSNKRNSLKSQSDYDILFEEYEKTTLANNFDSLLYVRDLVNKYKRVCLLCFERDPRQCHRTRIAKAILSFPDVKFKYSPIFV